MHGRVGWELPSLLQQLLGYVARYLSFWKTRVQEETILEELQKKKDVSLINKCNKKHVTYCVHVLIGKQKSTFKTQKQRFPLMCIFTFKKSVKLDVRLLFKCMKAWNKLDKLTIFTYDRSSSWCQQVLQWARLNSSSRNKDDNTTGEKLTNKVDRNNQKELWDDF